MAFCSKCGAGLQNGAPFCPACGAAQAGAAGAPQPPTPPGPAIEQTKMAENIAGLLCYVLGWITGLIFLLIDKRPFVKFHAAQSIVVFGGLTILRVTLGMIFGVGVVGGLGVGGWGLFGLIFVLIGLVGFVLWVVLMVKAYQGERFRVPLAADIAEQMFGKSESV